MTRWQIGLASAEITPKVGAELSGFAARQAPAKGVHDPLYAKCLAVSDGTNLAALLVLDVLGVDRELVSAIRHEVRGLPPNCLAVLATHTHGGPSTLQRALLGAPDPAYLAVLVQRSAEAVARAVQNLQEGVIRFGIGREGSMAHNRRAPKGSIDSEVPVMRLEDSAGGLLGLFTSYACHPVALGADNLLVTRDYPGELINTLEHLYPQAEVLFATGCAGQINPGQRPHTHNDEQNLEPRSFAKARRLGRALAGCVLQVSERIASPYGRPLAVPMAQLRVLQRTVELPLQAHSASEGQVERWRDELQTLRVTGGAPGKVAWLEAYLRWAETTAHDTRRAVPVELVVMALGKLVLVMFPGEVFVEFGPELKARFPEAHLITLAYCNDAPGYIPYQTAYAQGGYEVEEAFRFYGFPSVFEVSAGETLLEAATEMVGEILGEK